MEPRLRTLIVDDEPLARSRIRHLLAKETAVEVVGECGDGRTAQERLKAGGVELCFIDVQMPELDGFAALREIPRERLPQLVFVTAHDRYALRAFEVRALDYLLKPFDPDRFRETVARAVEAHRLRAGARTEAVLAALRELSERSRYPERLLVKESGRVVFVPVRELDCVEAAGNYVCLSVGKQSYTARETMGEMEAQLDPRRFVRIHRSTIVNVERIRELRATVTGDHLVLLESGRELPLGRSFKDRLREALGQGF